MFINYSNHLFSYRWSCWFVFKRFISILINIFFFLATKPTHATNHEFTLCQSKCNNQWIYHNPNGNCQEDHLEFGSVNNIKLKKSIFNILFFVRKNLGKILFMLCNYHVLHDGFKH